MSVNTTLSPGVYSASSWIRVEQGATLILDADGQADAAWIFNIQGNYLYLGGDVQIVNLPGYPGDDTVPAPVWWNTDGTLSIQGANAVGTFLSLGSAYVVTEPSADQYTRTPNFIRGSLLSLGNCEFQAFTSTTIIAHTYPATFPTAMPTVTPSRSPSVDPTEAPSWDPSAAPSVEPTEAPSVSFAPSLAPSIAPSDEPSVSPTTAPSETPSAAPSTAPSKSPSTPPTESPTVSSAPSETPSVSPSLPPSESPSEAPTAAAIAPVDLGLAQYFAVFGSVEVYSELNALVTMNGALGVNSGGRIDGWGVVWTVNGETFTNDDITAQVVLDITAAKADCLARSDQIYFAPEIYEYTVVTLSPGVYNAPNGFAIQENGQLILDAGGRSDAVWIFNGDYFYIAGTVQIVNLPGYPGDGTVPAPVWWNVDDVYDAEFWVKLQGANVVGTFLSSSWIICYDNNVIHGSLLSLTSVYFDSNNSNTTVTAYTYPATFPTLSPTAIPSVTPSEAPSEVPSDAPSETPSTTPSAVPTVVPPSKSPSTPPTESPTVSLVPSETPSVLPSLPPSESPSEAPTAAAIAPVDLGLAQFFAVFGGGYVEVDQYALLVTMNGALGVNSRILSYGSGLTVYGETFISDAITAQVVLDITAAKADCLGRSDQIYFDTFVQVTLYSPVTLSPGVYNALYGFAIEENGQLILDAGGHSDAVWIFNVQGEYLYFLGTVTIINLPGYPGDGTFPAPVFWNKDVVYDDGYGVHFRSANVVGTFLSNNGIFCYGGDRNDNVIHGSLLSLASVYFDANNSNTTITAYTYSATFPTLSPTVSPTTAPSETPSAAPSVPTVEPSVIPSVIPSMTPTNAPSLNPTAMPSESPTLSLSPIVPTATPTISLAPTVSPTSARPSSRPSAQPSSVPTLDLKYGHVSWKASTIPEGNTAVCMNSVGDRGLAARFLGGELYHTSNYGVQWTHSLMTVHHSSFSTARCSDTGQIMLAYGGSGLMFFSYDYGVTFTAQNNKAAIGVILTHDGNSVWSNVCNEVNLLIYKTNSSGIILTTFAARPVVDTDCNSVLLNFDRNGDAYYTDNLSLYVMRISTHSTSWTSIENLPSIIAPFGTRYLQIEFDTTRTYGNAISADVHYYTLDGCESWHLSNLPSSAAGTILYLHADYSGEFVTIATRNEIFTSFDYGVNFIANSPPQVGRRRLMPDTLTLNHKQIEGSNDDFHFSGENQVWNQLVGSVDGRHMFATTTEASSVRGTRDNIEFIPTHAPTSKPSSLPSGQPSARPSCQPTDQPTSQPSSQPFSKPSTQPRAEPSAQPSSQPNSRPSDRPSCQPSLQPSLQPTSNPSEIPPCGAGHTYTFTGVGVGYECTPCPSGMYTAHTAFECQICPAGFQSTDGSKCDACPSNFYSSVENSVTCTACAAGLTNAGTGNTLKSSCVNPQLNFIIAFICLGVCMLGIAVYIVGGRLHRMSFVRKEFLVSKTSEMYMEVLARLRVVAMFCQRDTEAKRLANLEDKTPVWKFALMCLLFVAVLCMVFLLFFFAAILRVFFTSLILWRGYSFTIDVPYISRISGFVESLSAYVHIPYITYVFYPFIYVVDYVASFNINLDSVNVTCLGSQIPMTLLADCFVVGIVVIVIESDVEVFWSTTFASVHREFRSLTLQRHFWKSGFWSNVLFIVWSVVLQLCPHPRKILQYGLGFVRVVLFFNTNYHAASSANCDAAIPVGSSGLDSILAMCSTILAYFLVFPLFYLLSQILVPDFHLQRGTVKTEFKIRKKLLQNAHAICGCEKCGLGLHRHYTDQFGWGLHCDWHNHVPPANSSPTKSNYQVVYGCSAVKICNWAICPVCYEKLHDEAHSGRSTPRSPLSRVATATSSDITPHSEDSKERPSVHRSAKSKTFVFDPLENDQQAETEHTTSDIEAVSATEVVAADLEDDAIELPEKQTFCSKMWNGFVYVLKCCMMIASIDWFYIKFTFVFAHYMFDALVSHLTHMNDIQSESDKSVKKPNLPWFYAVRDKHNDLKNEKLMIEEKWAEIAASFPSYYRMVMTVQDDLCPKPLHRNVMCNGCGVPEIVGKRYYSPTDKTFNLCDTCKHASQKTNKSIKTRLYRSKQGLWYHIQMCCAVAASWTILGQLASERGFRIWARVLHNYYVFILVSAGIWTEDAVRDFEIEHQFERQENENCRIEEIVNERTSASASPFKRGELQRAESSANGDIFSRTTDECDDRLQLISALVSTRVVLIQLIPYMTLYSTLAVDVSSSPIFIYSPFLKEKVSELFATNLDAKAKEELKSMGALEAGWKIALLKCYIFWEYSRALCFLQNIVSNFIALALIFTNGEILQKIMDFSMLWFILQSALLTIHPLILLHKLMFNEAKKRMKEDIEHKKSKHNKHNNEQEQEEKEDEFAPPKQNNNMQNDNSEFDQIYPEIEMMSTSQKNLLVLTPIDFTPKTEPDEAATVKDASECTENDHSQVGGGDDKLVSWYAMPTEI